MKPFKRLSGLKPYFKNLVVAACALVMLVAYFLMSPWMQMGMGAFARAGDVADMPAAAASGAQAAVILPPSGFQPPAGFEAPAGFDAGGQSALAGQAGTQASRTGQRLAARLQAGRLPGTTGIILIPAAAVVALVGAVGSAFRPRFNRLATILAVLAGLVALAYYVIFFVQDAAIPIDLSSLLTPGFWIALVASLGLVIQVAIPRRRERDLHDKKAAALVTSTRRSGLSIRQNLAVSIDALLANKLRSALTMLGIIIGVASVVSLTSVGQGAQNTVAERLGETGLNILTIRDGGGLQRGGPGQRPNLTYDDAEAIEEQVGGLLAVLPQFSGSLTVRTDQASYTASILGTTEQYLEANNLTVEIGRFFSEDEYESNKRVAVLGYDAAEELFGTLNPIGREVRIDRARFEVVGVLEEQDALGINDPNLQIFVPLTTGYRSLFDARIPGSSKNQVSQIVVAVADEEQVDAASTQIEAVLREQHDLDTDTDNDFNITSRQTLLETASNVSSIMTLLLGAIASISLMVGGIGIMNITLVSVTERTKEIGLRKAVGARRSHILQQFLFETVTLSAIGGLIGTLFGMVIAMLVDNSGLINTAITPESLAIGLGFSVLVGIFFGVYPARQAAALQPIEALRYE
ncbi:MAG: ABC transporter permease [Chloroflexi bacterium]|nr:ABC transporter permease [Chloroflexota bacterium]